MYCVVLDGIGELVKLAMSPCSSLVPHLIGVCGEGQEGLALVGGTRPPVVLAIAIAIATTLLLFLLLLLQAREERDERGV